MPGDHDPYAALRVADFRRFVTCLLVQTLATMVQTVVVVDPTVAEYIVRLVNGTRDHGVFHPLGERRHQRREVGDRGVVVEGRERGRAQEQRHQHQALPLVRGRVRSKSLR